MATKKQGKGSEQPSQPTLQELQERLTDRELQWSIECSLRNYIQLIERAIYQTQVEIQQAESDYNLNRAAQLKYGKLETLQEHLIILHTELERIKEKLAVQE